MMSMCCNKDWKCRGKKTRCLSVYKAFIHQVKNEIESSAAWPVADLGGVGGSPGTRGLFGKKWFSRKRSLGQDNLLTPVCHSVHRQGSHSDWKNGKSGNFVQTGKVRENDTKYWKTRRIWDKYYLIFLVIFKWTVYYLLKWIKFSVKKIKLKIYWKKIAFQ